MTDIFENLDQIVAIAGYKVATNDGKNVEALVNEIKEELTIDSQPLYYDPEPVDVAAGGILLPPVDIELDGPVVIGPPADIDALIDDIAADGGISTDEVDQLKEAIDASTEETSTEEAGPESGDQV